MADDRREEGVAGPVEPLLLVTAKEKKTGGIRCVKTASEVAIVLALPLQKGTLNPDSRDNKWNHPCCDKHSTINLTTIH